MGSLCSRSFKGPAATEDIQRILRKADLLLNVDRTSAPNRGNPLPGIGGTGSGSDNRWWLCNAPMCNLYSRNVKRDAVAQLFRVWQNRAPMVGPVPTIFLKHVVPVVRCAADGEREIFMLSWGFILLQNRKAPATGQQRPRRHNPQERLLERSISAARMPGSGDVALRAERRCEAGHMALVCACRHRDIRLPDDPS
jgi:hypothetical protein